MTESRKLADETLRQYDATGNIPLNSETLARELLKALDERDRLAEEVANERRWIENAAKVNREIRAERDRLREALREIAAGDPPDEEHVARLVEALFGEPEP
jgi:hypothetical protein